MLLYEPSSAIAFEPIENRLHRRAHLALAHRGKVVEELLPPNFLKLGSIRNLTNSHLLLLEDLIDFGKGVVGPACRPPTDH